MYIDLFNQKIDHGRRWQRKRIVGESSPRNN